MKLSASHRKAQLLDHKTRQIGKKRTKHLERARSGKVKLLMPAHIQGSANLDEQRVPAVVNRTPLCWACGYPMEWDSAFEEFELDGGEIVVQNPIFRCCNPQCDPDDMED
jgi:hypothetical protein